MEKIGAIKAIKEFFEGHSLGFQGRNISMAEMRELTPEDRRELGAMAAAALGKELDATAKVAS